MPDSLDPEIDASAPTPIRQPKRLMTSFAIASSFVLFACAGCCFLTNLILRPKVVDSPVGTREVAEQIIDWTLLPGFQGKSGLTINNALMRFDIARFGHETGRGVLVVGQLHSNSLPFPEQRTQTRELIEKFAPELRKINLDQTVSKSVTIHGLPAEFQIGSGEDRASTTRFHQVTGYFRGKLDDAILILQYEEDVLTNADVDSFIQSLK